MFSLNEVVILIKSHEVTFFGNNVFDRCQTFVICKELYPQINVKKKKDFSDMFAMYLNINVSDEPPHGSGKTFKRYLRGFSKFRCFYYQCFFFPRQLDFAQF